jgi:hypothetical protein
MPYKTLTPNDIGNWNLSIAKEHLSRTSTLGAKFDVLNHQGSKIGDGSKQMNGSRLFTKCIYGNCGMEKLSLEAPLKVGDTIEWEIENGSFAVKSVKQNRAEHRPTTAAPPDNRTNVRRRKSVRLSPQEIQSNPNLDLIDVVCKCRPEPTCTNRFKCFYEKFRSEMAKIDHYSKVCAEKVNELNWPQNFGVYAIWQTGPSDKLIYVGMTGKFSPDGRLGVTEGLSGRWQRTMPYCFTRTGDYANHFEFAPRAKSVKGLAKLQRDKRYDKRVPLDTLYIDCFIVNRKGLAAPAFLEAVILQFYLQSHGKLPEANNAF